MHDTRWAVECIETPEGLQALGPAWRELQGRSIRPSIFATFDYIHTAWNHFHGPKDRLLIVLVRKNGRLVAIAPFRIYRENYRCIPIRIIEWLAAWEGDRPSMLCAEDTSSCWKHVEHFLSRQYIHWDLLRLRECSTPVTADSELRQVSHLETELSSINFYIPLEDSFDQYLSKINTHVRTNWRKRHRKIFSMTPPPCVQKISHPEEMASAVSRFVALEQKGWKAAAGLGVGKDAKHQRFYAELTRTLALNGEAVFYFLRQGHQDMAGLLVFRTGDTVYSRHTAYAQEYAPLSPGIVLRSELIRELCGSRWQELDLLGLQPSLGRQRHKEDWALGHRTTELQLFFRHGGRLVPALAVRRLRHWWHGLQTVR